jgi:uridine kinase
MASSTISNHFQEQITSSQSSKKREIERKFIVTELPDLSKFYHYEIKQVYISITEGTERRIRQKTFARHKEFFITEKSTEPGLDRGEVEEQISEQKFRALLSLAIFPPTEKTRYEIPYGRHKIELDVFHGRLDGLVITEVEFKSNAAANKFHPPKDMRIDVTNDERYRNRNLARDGIPKDIRLEAMLRRNDPKRYGLNDGVQEAIDLVKKKLADGNKIVLVGVAGGSASGKSSTVAKKIIEAFGSDAILISIDDYFKDLGEISKMPKVNGFINYDTPNAVQLSLVWEHVHRLRKGFTVSKPTYDFKTGISKPRAEKITPRKVIVLEGLHALTNPKAFDVKVFVEASEFTEIIRRLPRDALRTDLQPSDSLSYFCKVGYPMQEQHVDPTRKNADLIIVNEYNPEIESQKTGIVDNQVKFRRSIDENSLIRLHAMRRSTVTQEDQYYETHESVSSEFANMLRIRIENGKPIFSYKGPSPSKVPRKQSRFEFMFADGVEELRTAMEAISNGTSGSITKERSIYTYNGVTINVDRSVVGKTISGTKELGSFVELSYIDEDVEAGTVDLITKSLGLTKPIHKQYIEML